MATDLSDSTKALMSKVTEEPSNWQARKAAAVQLYEEGHFLEAADVLWNAPEMPSVDIDVAFAVKIVSRARPNRSIRLLYEVLRRNVGKPEQNIAMARAFNFVGLPMLASRFYGAALAASPELFDIGFEQQTLWYDDSGSLMEAWKNSSQDIKEPLVHDIKSIVGKDIKLSELEEVAPTPVQNAAAVGKSVEKPAALGGSPVLRAATSVVPTKPSIKPAQPLKNRPSPPSAMRPAEPVKRAGSAPVPLRPAAPVKRAATAPVPLRPAVPKRPDAAKPTGSLSSMGDKGPKPMQPDAEE
ncbi:hypothetical protein ACFPK9_13970 [Rubritalea spongiae]|uniref:Tetratricopeptide repeat protein n=1 Tax=Rubritalea spongiae TaxID=430797 RepID=A0ABW5E102_9BACT